MLTMGMHDQPVPGRVDVLMSTSAPVPEGSYHIL